MSIVFLNGWRNVLVWSLYDVYLEGSGIGGITCGSYFLMKPYIVVIWIDFECFLGCLYFGTADGNDWECSVFITLDKANTVKILYEL